MVTQNLSKNVKKEKEKTDKKWWFMKIIRQIYFWRDADKFLSIYAKFSSNGLMMAGFCGSPNILSLLPIYVYMDG